MSDVSLEEMIEYMKIIRKSSLQFLEKIKDIVFISALDAEKTPMNFQTVPVENIFSLKNSRNFSHEMLTIENQLNVFNMMNLSFDFQCQG